MASGGERSGARLAALARVLVLGVALVSCGGRSPVDGDDGGPGGDPAGAGPGLARDAGPTAVPDSGATLPADGGATFVEDAGQETDAGVPTPTTDAGASTPETDGGAPDAGGPGSLPACPTFGAGTQRITKWLFARELSGLAESRRNPGLFWVHNDSGGKAEVFAMAGNGQQAAVVTLALPGGATALDWEDVAVGPGPQPGVTYLYGGDIGSNAVSRSTIVVYRVAEPTVSAPSLPLPAAVTLSQVEAFTFEYPGGIRNAETLMVDPRTGDVYVVEKRGSGASGVFSAAAPLSATGVTRLQEVATLGFGRAPLSGSALTTAGDISPDGSEVLIRSYDRAFLWRRAPGASVADALATPPCPVPLVAQNQGEAIGFALDGGGYYSASENSDAISFYPRQ